MTLVGCSSPWMIKETSGSILLDLKTLEAGKAAPVWTMMLPSWLQNSWLQPLCSVVPVLPQIHLSEDWFP